jgi:exonuclease III
LYDYIHEAHPITDASLQTRFPFLPPSLITEALRCHESLLEYSRPPPILITPITVPRQQLTLDHQTQIVTWNVASLSTALPNIYELITSFANPPAILVLQETKLTVNKSIKYIQNLFPSYKLLFNNTNTATRCMIRRGIPYTPTRGGLLTLIYKTYSYPTNLTKIPTPPHISPYLQIIRILNHPLQPWLLINMYMPSHLEDLPLFPNIETTIIQQIAHHPNHTTILCGDFNRDIAIIGRSHGDT